MNTESKRSTLSLNAKPATTKTTEGKSKKPLRSSGATRSVKKPTERRTTDSRGKTHGKASNKVSHKAPSKPGTATKPTHPKATTKTRAEKPADNARLDIDKLHVYRLPPSGLAYQISWAAHLLVAVGEGYSLQQLFAQIRMDEQARPNVQRLTFDALRHWGTTQFWLKNHIANPPAEWIQAVLCVALTQLLLQEENEFTLVNEAVLAIDNNKPHAKGMVNAILRRFLRERDDWIALAQTNEVAHYNHPQWWIDTLKAQYPNDWQQILTVNNSHPPMTLRVNTQQHSVTHYQELLAASGHSCQRSDLSPQALVLDTPCAVTSLPEFASGAVSVQDAGAQLSAQLMDIPMDVPMDIPLNRPTGLRVLDACAAPGGKTAHLLEQYNDIALTAIEKDPARAQRIHDNLNRLGLSAQVLVVDANNVHQWWDGQPFERILLDAPCSASGIVRRHPDIRWLRQADDLGSLAQQQAALLRTMWKVLAVGGRLVYCTCSIFTPECDGIIETFLQHTPNARRVYPTVLTQLQQTERIGQLLPNTQAARNHDGFFYAVLEKTDTLG